MTSRAVTVLFISVRWTRSRKVLGRCLVTSRLRFVRTCRVNLVVSLVLARLQTLVLKVAMAITG